MSESLIDDMDRQLIGMLSRDARISNRKIALDLDVTGGAHGQVEARVAAQRGEHVVVERHTGVDVDLAGAVDVEVDDDVGFLGATLDARAAGG